MNLQELVIKLEALNLDNAKVLIDSHFPVESVEVDEEGNVHLIY